MTKRPLVAVNSQMGAGGACSQHGVYIGLCCPKCAKTKALASLRQATWEAMQWLDGDEAIEYVTGVVAEVESDEP